MQACLIRVSFVVGIFLGLFATVDSVMAAHPSQTEVYRLTILSVDVSVNNGASWVRVATATTTYDMASVAENNSLGTYSSAVSTLPANTTVNLVKVTFRCTVAIKGLIDSLYTRANGSTGSSAPAVEGTYTFSGDVTGGECSSGSTFSKTAGVGIATDSSGRLALNIKINQTFPGNAGGTIRPAGLTLSVSAP